jgi:uncharacterized protein YigA (DUF484 family)
MTDPCKWCGYHEDSSGWHYEECPIMSDPMVVFHINKNYEMQEEIKRINRRLVEADSLIDTLQTIADNQAAEVKRLREGIKAYLNLEIETHELKEMIE